MKPKLSKYKLFVTEDDTVVCVKTKELEGRTVFNMYNVTPMGYHDNEENNFNVHISLLRELTEEEQDAVLEFRKVIKMGNFTRMLCGFEQVPGDKFSNKLSIILEKVEKLRKKREEQNEIRRSKLKGEK